MTMLHLVLALAWCKRPSRPNPDLTDDQYNIMRAIDFVGHRSFLMADNFLHTLFLFLGFAVLTVIRSLPVSMTALSALLFLASLFCRRLITHASYSLMISTVLLASDAVMAILYPSLSVPQGTAPGPSFWPLPIDLASYIPAPWPLKGCMEMLHYLLKTMPGLSLHGVQAVVSILLILACLCMLFRIRRVAARIFYLRESYRFYAILGFVRCIVLSHLQPSSGASDLGMLVAFLGRTSLYILACCAIHLILVAYTGAKSVSIEKEKVDAKEKK